jgi:methylthioribose-1-phosphate isomerase
MRSLAWIQPSVESARYKLRFIDQTKLPTEEIYITTDDYHIVANAIRKLSIRGAPAIGVAAAYGVALAAIKYQDCAEELFHAELLKAINELQSTRPTAVNLFWALDRMKNKLENSLGEGVQNSVSKLIDEALKIHDEDICMCEAIGRNGAELIPLDAAILTHCNTGALATGGDGTAQNVIVTAFRQGKRIKVFACETRPLLQGARLTAWELTKLGIDITLITDNTAAFLMQQKKINLVITGADRITTKGYVANKVGTFSIASLAKLHKIPFYVAAPASTIDFNTKEGKDIIIEERNPDEVTEIAGKKIAPAGVKVYSPAFDITPPELISGIITNIKILYPPYELSDESNR